MNHKRVIFKNFYTWLVLPASNSARVFFNLPGDDATGIATIENKQQNADNVWYDLNGCRINAPGAQQTDQNVMMRVAKMNLINVEANPK